MLDISIKISELVESGLTPKEAISLIGLRIEQDTEKLKCGSGGVKQLLTENVIGEDFSIEYSRFLQAGLTEDEACKVFRDRFIVWLSELRVIFIRERLRINGFIGK